MVHSMKQNGKLNGINNKAFVDDERVIPQLGAENEGKGSKKKPAPAPPSPPIQQSNGILDNEIPAEITKLDEILDEAANSIENMSIERKLSADTVSNVSDFVPHKENVTVDVHCDNVVTPADSQPPSFSSEQKDSLPDEKRVEIEETPPKDLVEENRVQKEAPNVDDVIEKHAEHNEIHPTVVLEENKIQKEAPNAVPNLDENLIAKDTEIDELPSKDALEENDIEKDSPPVPKDSPDLIKPEPQADKSGEVSTIPIPPPTPDWSTLNNKKTQEIQPPVPPPPLPSRALSMTDLPAVIRPTSSSLRSVTLKPIKRREELQMKEEEEEYEPDDDNLKIGSDKYKNFLENLGGKLQKLNAVPAYITHLKTLPNPNPKPVSEEVIVDKNPEQKPNENVIADNINKIDAMEKLGSFISDPSRNKGILGNINNVLASDQNPTSDGEATKENDGDDAEEDKRSDVKERSSDEDFREHKKRMQNVFRSVNLKKAESMADPEGTETRNVKSLGHHFSSDDKSKHRQAMSEIFKSITLMRKDSQKRVDGE